MKKLAFALVFVSLWAQAQDDIGPMAGTGGVMRDAERRALSTETPRDVPQVPEISVSKSLDDLSSGEQSGVMVGPVESVVVYGSRDFAEQEDIAGRLLAELGEGDKTLDDITEAIRKVRQDLLEKGYYLVRLVLSRKDTYNSETKTLGVQVDEGRFGKINLMFEDGENGSWFSREQVFGRFKDINEGETFDYKRLRSALFDANSHPDLTIDTAIDVRKPIEGEDNDRRIARYADLNLTVRESFPLHMVWELNNYGMEEVEEWQTSLTVQYMNLTKHDDVLTISPSMSVDGALKSIAASYMLPHTYWLGGNMTLYGGYSTLDVDNVVPQLSLEGTGWFFGLQHSEYLYDTDDHLLAVSAGILCRYMEDQYTAMKYKLDQRNATIMPISLAFSYTSKRPDFLGGRNFATVQGVYNIMHSGDALTDIWTGAEDKYWILRWQLARLQPLFGWYDPKTNLDLHQWMLFFKLEGQYTDDSLIPLEKLSLGGYNCMRGYRTRGYLGDYGFYGTVELRTPIMVDAISAFFGDRTDKTAIDRMQFLAFVDYGWLAYNNLSSGEDNESIYSAGFGARFSVTKYTQLKCDVAFPLKDTDWADDNSMEVYFSMQVQF